MNRNIYRSVGMVVLLLSLLCSCTSDEADTPEVTVPADGQSEILISSGLPGSVAATRDVDDAPSVFGYCNADRLQLRVYRNIENYSTTVLTPYKGTNMGDSCLKVAEVNVDYHSDTNRGDKVAYYHYNQLILNGKYTTYVIPALAYSSTQAEDFILSGENTKYSDLTLIVRGNSGIYHTPEVYYGLLNFKPVSNVPNVNSGDYGSFYYYKASSLVNGSFFAENVPLRGKLYRIVSMFNLNITDVDPKVVEKMELYVTDLPLSISLKGKHGTYYPVSDALTYTSGKTLVAEATDFSKGQATLSTYMLPSVHGHAFSVKVTYKGEGILDSYGVRHKEMEYPVDPYNSVLLESSVAKVYNVNDAVHETDAKGSKTGRIYIFKGGADNKFYSYSNVRTNISGKFKDIFTDRTTTDIVVEVCYNYEGVHTGFNF